MFNETSIIDYAVTDSPYYDPEYPSLNFPTHFMSGGSPVQACMWIAGGQGPRGCVIIASNLYGGDNFDSIIVPLVSAGMHVLTYHPRGMYDGRVEFSMEGAIEDVHSAVAYVRGNGGRLVSTHGRQFEVDPERVAIFGWSGGGGCVGWGAAAENPNLNTAIAVGVPNVELHRGGLSPESAKEYQEAYDATAGRLDLAKWLGAMTPETWDRISLIKQAPKLASKNLLLIGGSATYHCPLDLNHRPIAQAQRDAGNTRFTEVILEGDMYFITARIAMARTVINWLKTECGF